MLLYAIPSMAPWLVPVYAGTWMPAELWQQPDAVFASMYTTGVIEALPRSHACAQMAFITCSSADMELRHW
uniref:Putative secreted protein n=1 Tax=Ixodes ricinus TaxID=34613 RepID=A0A147BD25_IXORI